MRAFLGESGLTFGNARVVQSPLKEVFPTANIETSKKTSNEGCAQDGVGPLSAQAESRIQARSNSNAVQQGATMATLDLIGSSAKFPAVLDAINTGALRPAPLRPASTGKITTTTSAHRRPIRSKCRWPSRCSPTRSIAPESWSRQAYPPLYYLHEVAKGGHFTAWEQPEVFSEEIRAAFRSLR
jgi:hypothetical protein